MNRLLAVSVLGAALLLATLATVLYRSGGDDRAASASSAVPAPAADSGTGKALAAPKGEPVLRIKGVERGNVSETQTVLDFATLDRAASEELTIVEPFVKRRMTFTAISMSDLLHRAGVDPSARRLYMLALDDYHVDLPIAGLREAGFVATRVEGKRIPIAMGGPVRLVFTGNGKLARDTDNWIWSLDSARVER